MISPIKFLLINQGFINQQLLKDDLFERTTDVDPGTHRRVCAFKNIETLSQNKLTRETLEKQKDMMQWSKTSVEHMSTQLKNSTMAL